MSEYIDPIVVDAVAGKPLPEGHEARRYTSDMPSWHPVRRLLTGESQWLGQNQAVYAFLRLFCEIYADYIWPPDGGPDIDAPAEFLRLCPDDVLFYGRRYKLHRLYANARSSIESMTSGFPPIRTIGLDAFDRTFLDLVRAVRSNFTSPR
jgi:hypothetical protein